MDYTPKLGVLPIGKLTSEDIKFDFESVKNQIRNLNFYEVIADPVFEQKEVIAAADRLRKEDIDLLVLVPLHGAASEQQVLAAETCKCFTVVWSLPPRYSMPSGAIAYGALVDKGFKVKYIYGSPSAEVAKKIECAAKVVTAINRAKKNRIGVVGRNVAPQVSNYYNQSVLRDRLGAYVVNVSVSEIRRALEDVKIEDVEQEFSRIQRFKIMAPTDLVKEALKFHLALEKIIKIHGLDALAMECWTELFGLFNTTPCMGFIEDDYVIACEGDAVSAALLLMTRCLTGKPSVLLDVFTLQDDILTLGGNCSGAASIADDNDVIICEKAVPPQFFTKGKAVAVRPEMKWREVTLLRITGRNLDRMHMVPGYIVEVVRLPEFELKIRLTGETEAFLRNLHGHHYTVMPGDLRKEIELLCYLMDIDLVIT